MFVHVTCTNILSVKCLVKIYHKLQWWRINQDRGTSSSLEAQINEWGALMLLSTVTSLMGKAGEAAKRTGPRSSS